MSFSESIKISFVVNKAYHGNGTTMLFLTDSSAILIEKNPFNNIMYKFIH